MREKEIEKKLVKAVKERKGMALKFICPGLDGVPDRLILMPNGRMAFIELKAGEKPLRPIQQRRKRQIESLGFKVFRLDDTEKIGGVLDEIQSA